MVSALEMRAKAGRVMHSGNLNKEKRKLRVGSVLDHGALSFHSRFFVVEPGLLSWWAEEAEQVASQPPKGTMVLDQMTAISNNKVPFRVRVRVRGSREPKRHLLRGGGEPSPYPSPTLALP